MVFSDKTLITHIAEPAECSGRSLRRLFVNDGVLKASKILSGDIVIASIWTNGAQNSLQVPFTVGMIWPSSKVGAEEVHMSSSLISTARLHEGARVRLHPLPKLHATANLTAVKLREVNEQGSTVSSDLTRNVDKAKGRDWLLLLVRETLVDLKYITPWQVVNVVFEGKARLFAVTSVSDSTTGDFKLVDTLTSNQKGVSSVPVFVIDWNTLFTIEDAKDAPLSKTRIENAEAKGAGDAYSSVGGLDKQIAQIRDLVDIPFLRPDLFRYFGLKPPRGLLLHGPPGTGKTHLARSIATSTGSSVIIVNGPELTSAYHGETEASLRRVFTDARARAPCIIVLDEVDAICPRREDGSGGEVEKRVVATLLTEMDGVQADEDARVLVVATTNRPNAIDPALRRPGRFDREIEIGVPDIEARMSILNVLLKKTPNTTTVEELRAVASRAHGYVGADLSAVVREAGILAIKRSLSPTSPQNLTVTATDLTEALPTIRPSALRAHAVSTAAVRFSDIGGLDTTIARLRECVEWPLVHAETLARLGVRAPRGVLLCGPPGCSKTVLVRAIATETGVNFVAVRGPELLNKYVGESERAVREIFRKARAAAPSIIFFDEIDALAQARESSLEGAHNGVLTSLLNEMDGVEELAGVTVIGATNRPDVLDSALLRPGRLDRIIYVGPPDFDGRVDILRIRTRTMSVDPALDLKEVATLTDGYSGAEISALCQEAAILAMQEDINAPFVPHKAFVYAAKSMKRQITPEMIQSFARWRNTHGVSA